MFLYSTRLTSREIAPGFRGLREFSDRFQLQDGDYCWLRQLSRGEYGKSLEVVRS